MKFVSIAEIQNLCDHKYPESIPTRHGETLFVHPDLLIEFTNTLLPTLTVPFVLVTGCSDYTFPMHYPKESNLILRNPVVLKWYAQNCAMKVGKFEQLPIGMDYHSHVSPRMDTLFEGLPIVEEGTDLEGEGWVEVDPHPVTTTSSEYPPNQQESDILSLLSTLKESLCYGNFHFFTESRYGGDREEAKQAIPSNCIFYEKERISREKVFEKMAKYKYVISPFGNGLDCYRTWEALALGCIPIIRSSGLDSLFKGLPVMIVNSWSEVTREKLDTFVPDYSQIEKITLDYWMRRLNSHLKE